VVQAVWSFPHEIISVSPVVGFLRGVTTSTRHIRHMPAGFNLGWWQKTGMSMPICLAALAITVPEGTVTSCPSMVRVTVLLSLILVYFLQSAAAFTAASRT
jgi:hypothetical protein